VANKSPTGEHESNLLFSYNFQCGSRFGYALVWFILMSNMIAVLLQTLAARLGIVTGKDRPGMQAGIFKNSVLHPVDFVRKSDCRLRPGGTPGHHTRVESSLRSPLALGRAGAPP
jgi:hypothetical protein